MHALNLDVEVTRGDIIESRHRVHAAVIGADDVLVAAARDSALVTMWRSCAKPFQVLPFLSSGGFEQLGWGHEELALACASHGGEPEHVAIVARMLASLGLEEGDLACGPHDPLSTRGAKLLRESGAPSLICSQMPAHSVRSLGSLIRTDSSRTASPPAYPDPPTTPARYDMTNSIQHSE